MSADTDLRDALIERWRHNPNRWIVLDQQDLESLADIALAVIKDWTAEEPYARPRKANEPDSFWYWRKWGLGTRATCVLLRADIPDLERLKTAYPVIDWSHQPNCGPKTVAEIANFVASQF